MASMLAMVVLLGGKEKAVDKGAPKLPIEARAHPPAGMALDVATGDSSWIPGKQIEARQSFESPGMAVKPQRLCLRSDGSWTIPTPMGCLEAKCEGHMAAMGKAISDHDNINLLDCKSVYLSSFGRCGVLADLTLFLSCCGHSGIQRTGMSNAESVKCFSAAKLESSATRSALFDCGICKGCLVVAGEAAEDHCSVASSPASPSVLDHSSSGTAPIKAHSSIPATASDSP